MKAALSAKELELNFVDDCGQPVPVLEGLDLTAAPGEFLCLLGPTGAGKTTLLRLLTGLLQPTGGRLMVGGHQPRAGKVKAGGVFQQNSLLPWRRLLANVTFPLEMRGMPRREAEKRGMALLEEVGLAHRHRAFPYELSGGMQQRGAIARALAQDQGLLLLDEPFGALDDHTRGQLQQSLLELWGQKGMTVVFITHNIEEALILGDRIAVMGRGRIIHDQPVALARPRDPLAPEFSRAFLQLRKTLPTTRVRQAT